MAELVCFKCKQVVASIEQGTIKKKMKTICDKCMKDWYGDDECAYGLGGPVVAFIKEALDA